MRRFAANDRLISNEQTAATVDGPERETYVETDTNPTNPATLEVGCDAGTVVIAGTDVSVSAQSEAVPDLTNAVTETAYAYHTLSIDNTGALVVRTSDTGEFDAANPGDPPITQVTEPSHAAGECYIGTAFQVEGSIERVFDGRYVIGTLPNSIITQGQGSGLDADTVRGEQAVPLSRLKTEDGSFSISGNDDGTQTITFANTYDSDLISWGVSVYTDSNNRDQASSAAWSNWNTDGNGDITGMDIDWNLDVTGATVQWNVFGLTAV